MKDLINLIFDQKLPNVNAVLETIMIDRMFEKWMSASSKPFFLIKKFLNGDHNFKRCMFWSFQDGFFFLIINIIMIMIGSTYFNFYYFIILFILLLEQFIWRNNLCRKIIFLYLYLILMKLHKSDFKFKFKFK